MAKWELDGEEFTLSEIATGIRTRGSHISDLLVNKMRQEKAVGSDNSVALTIIDQLKGRFKYKFLKNDDFRWIDEGFCEDSYNEALLTIYQRIEKFDGSRSSLNTWLDHIIFWKFKERYPKFIKEMYPQRSFSLDDENDIQRISLLASGDWDNHEGLWQNELLLQVKDKLTDQQRAIVELAEQGYTPTSMVNEGLIQGVSVNAVSVSFSAARKRLQALLAEAGWKVN